MKKVVFIGIVSALLVSGASAQVGKWAGRVDMKTPDLSKVKDPKQKAQAQQMLASMKAFIITMELKADKTLVMRTPAVKLPNGMSRPASTASGTWKVSGSSLIMRINKTDGKAVPADKVKDSTGTLSADKSMITIVPPEGGGNVKIIFKKG